MAYTPSQTTDVVLRDPLMQPGGRVMANLTLPLAVTAPGAWLPFIEDVQVRLGIGGTSPESALA